MENFNDKVFIGEIKNGIRITPDAFKIGEAAVLGMLYEVSAYPSPGLVSPISKGAHEDMDFFLFLKSISSITHVMYICAQIGIDYDDDILQRLRCIGKTGEGKMLKETSGVNTQRGILFLAGIVSGAAGRCIRLKKKLCRENISEVCGIICRNIVQRELVDLSKNKDCINAGIIDRNDLTNGEKLYLKYGITGVRGEIEKGLPSVMETGLPYYEAALSAGLDTGTSLSHSLVALMTVVEDTTVINRCGIEGLKYMKESALCALRLGGMETSEGKEYIKNMDKEFIKRRISPGGAADLLSVTVMIKKLEENFQ